MVNYGWKWSLLLFYLDAVATVHVLKAGNHDVKKLSKLELYILQD